MPGCMYPISIDHSKVISVNALEYNSVIGRDSSYIDYCGYQEFSANERVIIKCTRMDSGQTVDLPIIRYIVGITNRYALQSDDYTCRLSLSPFNPVRS